MKEPALPEGASPIKAVVVPRRRWPRRAALGGLLAIAAAVGALLYLRWPERPDCKALVGRGEFGSTTIAACRDEYERTRLPATGVLYVEALIRSGEQGAARGIVTELLATEARADALFLRGQIEFQEQRLDAAFESFQEARKHHRDGNQRAAAARDAMALAGIHNERAQLVEALHSLDECIVDAQAAAAASIEGRCHLAAARVLIHVGYFAEARRELEKAEPLLSTTSDQAQLWRERGNLEQEQSRGRDVPTHEERAIAAFDRALELARRARLAPVIIQLELNLAFSHAELLRIDEARRHLDSATTLDRDGRYKLDLEQIAARIAYRAGNLNLAAALNERLYAKMPPGDDRFEVTVMQARIMLALNDLVEAQRWARRGIDEVEKIRAAQVAIELRPWVLASRRAPYEILFVVLARMGRLEEAVQVFDQWQGRTLLDTMSRPRLDSARGLATTAGKLQHLVQWLPTASNAPLISARGPGAVEALRSIDLLALAVAEGDLWRVTARRGQIRIDKIGTHAGLIDRLDRFRARPTEHALAGELGALLVPAELFQDRSTLYVVLDAPLADLPVAALRRDGKPLIVRPVLRAPRLPTPATAACPAASAGGGATVLADAQGNLPDASRESRTVAALLNTSARIGPAATSTALLAATSAPVLHVAVHGELDTGGGILRMYDRSVSALEISAARLGPPLVVLSGCNTARSDDPEIAGSLSTAFLASGSSRVVATLRPVSDKGAGELTARFYREGGLADPVRTLARIQAELAEGTTPDWPHFAVFGSEACEPAAPGAGR